MYFFILYTRPLDAWPKVRETWEECPNPIRRPLLTLIALFAIGAHPSVAQRREWAGPYNTVVFLFTNGYLHQPVLGSGFVKLLEASDWFFSFFGFYDGFYSVFSFLFSFSPILFSLSLSLFLSFSFLFFLFYFFFKNGEPFSTTKSFFKFLTFFPKHLNFFSNP